MIRELAWVQDGLAERELRAVQGLIYFARYGGRHFQEQIEEPWVLEGRNLPAMRSLGNLARRDSAALDRIMIHPTIADGITDEEAKVVAVLHGVQQYNPPLVDVLLDPERVMLEERTITLPLVGEVELTMIRTRPGVEDRMDLLEEAVRAIEEFMSVPFPVRDVIWLFEEAVPPGVAGANFGTHVATLPDAYDDETPIKSPFRHFIHESSHHYWRGGSAPWINEGATTFLEAVIETEFTGWPIAMERNPCHAARHISDDNEGECPYRLGERIFHDLYRNIDQPSFRLGFRQLYLLSQSDDSEDGCDGTDLGICHVEAAFTADAPAETSTKVEQVISRQYHGTEPPDLSFQDIRPANPELPSINGRIDRAWVSTGRGEGPQVARFSASDRPRRLYINIEYSHLEHSGPDSLTLQSFQYFEGDGFSFNWDPYDPLDVDGSSEGRVKGFSLGGESTRGPAGQYWVYVYQGDQKVAEVSYEITP